LVCIFDKCIRALANLRGFKNLVDVNFLTYQLLLIMLLLLILAFDFLAAFDLRLFLILILIFFGKARGFWACFSFM
jgi:hypothetical protein